MATASIKPIRWLQQYCGGSAPLAWLIFINTVVSVALMAAEICGAIFHFDITPVVRELALPPLELWVSRPWTLLTYMFVQTGFLHLVCNLIWLFWFGIIVVRLKPRAILPLYLNGGAAGAAAFFLACHFTSSSALLVGCSASALAIMTACAVWAPNMEMRFFLIGNVRLKWLAPACILLCFLGGINSPGSLWAHAAGVFFGCIYALAHRGAPEVSESAPYPAMQAKKPQQPQRRRPAPTPPAEGAGHVARAAQGRLADSNRLNELLDKIRRSGYASLSSTEKHELEALSKRINN